MWLLIQGLVQRLQLPLQVGWKLAFNVVHKIWRTRKQYTHNVTVSRVRATIVSVEKQ